MAHGDPVNPRPVLLCSLLLVWLAGCGPTPGVVIRPVGGLIVKCDQQDAVLFIDDKYLGTVASQKGRAVRLPEGLHRIEVRKEGYFAHFAEVTVAKGVRQKLEVKLRKEPF